MTRYCGREFTDIEIGKIRSLITDHPKATRAGLSRLVCEALSWKKRDGGLKEMSCRVAMLRMEADGLIRLPPPSQINGNGKRYRRRTPLAEPGLFSEIPSSQPFDLDLELVSNSKASHLWNEYIDRYHYLGYQPLPGAQIRYFAKSRGEVLALLGFGAAAWKTAPRDRWIGWTPQQRETNLPLLINNARFLILPWIRSKNLASRILGLVARQVADDWEKRYHIRPVLMETFVEIPRFQGTCYKAANWIYLGDTQGRGKLDHKKEYKLPKKSIWAYPLTKDFRQKLGG